MYMFNYCYPNVMKKLEPDQQIFMAKMIMRDVDKAAKETGLPPEKIYRWYTKGLYGGDREGPDFIKNQGEGAF